MKTYLLHQKVIDCYTGRTGKIVKVMMQDGVPIYRVKFCSYTEDFHPEELKGVKPW